MRSAVEPESFAEINPGIVFSKVCRSVSREFAKENFSPSSWPTSLVISSAFVWALTKRHLFPSAAMGLKPLKAFADAEATTDESCEASLCRDADAEPEDGCTDDTLNFSLF